MLGSSLLPSRFRGAAKTETTAPPSWLNKRATLLLQTLSHGACLHPIHTIVIVAFLASTTYMGLLGSSLFDSVGSNGKADWGSLVEGSRQLRVGSETAWKWQMSDAEALVSADDEHLALLTFVFPGSLVAGSPETASLADAIPRAENFSVTALPSTANPLTPISQDSTLAFSVPYSQAPGFLAQTQELPNYAGGPAAHHGLDEEQKMWIMRAAKAQGGLRSIRQWASNAVSEFLDLIKNAETMDIIIMALGYLSMHLTFVSLFVSMRRMGSNFWLFATTLFSSVFAFLFGLIVTTKMGVPINMVLLSEGLPFLVVTIGFEKAITLSNAVLSAALDSRRGQPQGGAKGAKAAKAEKYGVSSTSIQYAVQTAINEKGYEIVKDYVIEICILIAGAASGVQGGLQQFCFLAAWILFFDGILLFTFYTAILSIKLEINRIKRHMALRQALEDDGVNRSVAENVARSNDWPKANGNGEANIFGQKAKESSVPKFKVIMVSGFVIINLINICTIPFRSGNVQNLTATGLSGHGLTSVLNPAPMDPFKVASSGLDFILGSAKSGGKSTVVTILTPIKYELEYPSVHYNTGIKGNAPVYGDADYADYGMSSRVVDSLLKSLEDPILSKWIIAALVLSVILNGYLFNAARWSIKEPLVLHHHAVDPVELNQAEQFNTSQSTVSLNRVRAEPQETLPPPTPALTDDEDEHLAMGERQPEKVVPKRSQAQLEQILQEKKTHELTDDEVIELSLQGKIPGYSLERSLKDTTRAVKIRRAIISRTPATAETTGQIGRAHV